MVFSGIAKIRKRILPLLAVLLLSAVPAAGSEAIREATEILERWTSFHWGRDCLVWIVHYPEELVDPWVESEAARGGMSEGKRKNTGGLLSPNSGFPRRNPSLSPFTPSAPAPWTFGGFVSAVSLVNKNGDKAAPLSYERKFDQPVSGIVQGWSSFRNRRTRNFPSP